MPLTPGARLGAYEILGSLGQGGMGIVYRARDTTLDREVAIKTLPDAFASDPDRVARFEREAKLLASLNHPHIATIHGLEEADGVRALVLELVEGPTLADLIAGEAHDSPLPPSGSRRASRPIAFDDALSIARQIAGALEAAHEAGVIHRDLKPANVKVRPDGTVKVLDFGLAKAVTPDPSAPAGASQSPTITTPAHLRQGYGGQAHTQQGVILGTAAYMSPEQAKGQPVDRRADVWAFGAVLYELLTGRRAFEGDDVSDTLANVLKVEPNWAALPAELSPTLRAYLKRCLHKDPKQRVGDIHDVRLALEGAFDVAPESSAAEVQAPPPPGWRRALPWVVAAVLGVALAATAVRMASLPEPSSDSAFVTRFAVTLPADQAFTAPAHRVMAVSPDGQRLAYAANNRIYVRHLDTLEPQPVRGTDASGPTYPTFSPDGTWLAYVSNQRNSLMRVPAGGGAALPVIELTDSTWGLDWSADDTLLFVQADGIKRVPAAGGEVSVLVGTEAPETADAPQLLPGGRHLLYALAHDRGPTRWADASIVVRALDTGETTIVQEKGASPRYVPTGHLVYERGGALLAVPFDMGRLAATDTPMQVVDGVAAVGFPGIGNNARYEVSDRGSLTYVPATTSGSDDARTIVWVDREGHETPTAAASGAYLDPRLSPDGQRVAVAVDEGGNTDVYVLDLLRGGRTRLTFDPAVDRSPLWTPDGRDLLFSSTRGGGQAIYRKAADGSGQVELVASEPDRDLVPYSWSADAQTLLLHEEAGSGGDIGAWSFGDNPGRTPLLQEPIIESQPTISPDGRWIAYLSFDPRAHIYVRPFPDVAAGRYDVAPDGWHPVWSPRGGQLFYREWNGTAMMAVDVQTEPTFRAGVPERLFSHGRFDQGERIRQWDVSPDGNRFLMIRPADADESSEPSPSRIVVVEDWFDELRRLVPTN